MEGTSKRKGSDVIVAALVIGVLILMVAVLLEAF